MRWKDIKLMGRIAMPITLTNGEDLTRLKDGTIRPDQVRRVTLEGVVDTGATRLVIPEVIANQLGVPSAGEVGVRYANGRSMRKALVSGVHLSLMGRDGDFKALVEPGRKDALIGAIVMEELDFLIDCTNQRLYPRDPDVILTEAE